MRYLVKRHSPEYDWLSESTLWRYSVWDSAQDLAIATYQTRRTAKRHARLLEGS